MKGSERLRNTGSQDLGFRTPPMTNRRQKPILIFLDGRAASTELKNNTLLSHLR